ncbi:MAG: ComEC/Rec2 family competence protein [Gordonia sp. (in: high G+C Gram-positive bacteria)]
MATGDVRLVFPAFGAWLAVVVALCAPWGVALGAVVVLIASGVAGWIVADRYGRRRLAATLLGVCGVSATAGIAVLVRISAVDASPVSGIEGKPVVELEVTGDPSILGGGVRAMVPVKVVAVSGSPTRPVDAQLGLQASDLPDLLPGERISVRVRASPPRGGPRDRLTVARLSAVGELRVVRQAPVWQRWAGTVRSRLRESSSHALDPRAAGLLPGLVLGDVGNLDPVVRQQFRAAGLSHLTAVSGANFSLVVGAVVLGVRLVGVPTRPTVALGLLATVGFVVLVRPSDSVLRAAIMGSVGLVAALGSRRAQALPALGAAVVLIMLAWPQMALAPGFLLSVVATLGLVLWATPIRFALAARGIPDALATLLAMTVAAQILTTPVLMLVAGQVSLVSVPANLLVAPVIAPIGLLGTLAALIGAIGPPGGAAAVVAELLLRATTPEMWWLLSCAEWFGTPSWASMTVPGWQAVVVLALAAVFGRWCWVVRRDASTAGRTVTTALSVSNLRHPRTRDPELPSLIETVDGEVVDVRPASLAKRSARGPSANGRPPRLR